MLNGMKSRVKLKIQKKYENKNNINVECMTKIPSFFWFVEDLLLSKYYYFSYS